jgi:YHS domain-containing protein
MVMQMYRRMVLVALSVTLFPLLALAAAGPKNVDGQGVAIHGHDPVAYFNQGKPVVGRPEYHTTVGIATYWFANAQNQQQFKSDPSKYEPQYGGYCAYGVAQGLKPDVDPTAFTIVDGKLYLNLSPFVLKRWQDDIPGNITSANENWPGLKNK